MSRTAPSSRWGTRVASLALVLGWLQGCLGADAGVFYPVHASHYDLPGNDIPAASLQEHTITTEDGVQVVYVSALHGDARPLVALLHGQAGNIDDAWWRVMALWHLGFDVAVLDYRGFGKSSGSPSEVGLYRDAAAFAQALVADPAVDPDRLVIWGHSLGTGVASELAVGSGACALVLESPFTSLSDMIEHASPYSVEAGWVTDYRFDTLSRIGRVTMPVMVAHSTDDARIPIWMGEAVYAAAPEPKRFVRAVGARHDDVLAREGARLAATLGELAACAVP